MAICMAGGGVNARHVVGATDEIGEHVSEVVHPIRDLHVTMLRLMGLDDTTNSPTSMEAASSSSPRPEASQLPN